MAAAELASVVAVYLRKHGFVKTLAAFSRETGDMPEEKDIVDLETLFKLYTSTVVNGDTKAKNSKKSKLEDTLEVGKGNKITKDNAEEKVNEDGKFERKRKKKSERENLVVSFMAPKSETKNVLEEGSKKKKEKSAEKGKTMEVLKSKVENCSTVAVKCFEDGSGLAAKQEDARSPKSPTKRSNKEEQEGQQLAGSDSPLCRAVSTQVSSQEDGLSKKKRKKSKVVDGKVTKEAIATESACRNGKTEKLDVMKEPVKLLGEPEKCETSSKKKKKRKESSLVSEVAINGSLQESPDSKPGAMKNEKDLIDGKKRSDKKNKRKEDTSLVNGISSQDHNSSMASPEKDKEAGGAELAHESDVEKRESGSTKTKKHKVTPNNKKTPTGAIAFKRVEEEKVSFSDPRLRDNSYWAKDGAEEGYGAKAQEVLGLVRGRGFRHEKTKKKRGSYRGGSIGFESHSIKFENSDEG